MERRKAAVASKNSENGLGAVVTNSKTLGGEMKRAFIDGQQAAKEAFGNFAKILAKEREKRSK